MATLQSVLGNLRHVNIGIQF